MTTHDRADYFRGGQPIPEQPGTITRSEARETLVSIMSALRQTIAEGPNRDEAHGAGGYVAGLDEGYRLATCHAIRHLLLQIRLLTPPEEH
jgi:hypothetical protein